MRNLSRLALVSLCLVLSTGMYGQKAKLRKAEEAMESLKYKEAIEYYQQVLEKHDVATAKIQLADAYRKINDFPQAEYWYSQVVELPQVEAIHYYYYGLMLQRNGRCEEAQGWYDRFTRLKSYDPRKPFLKDACDYQKTLLNKGARKVQVQVMDFNSQYDDIGPAFYEDGLVFGSVRSETEEAGSSLFFHLYYVTSDSLVVEANGQAKPIFGAPKKFSAELDSKAHEAIVSFSQDQQEIFLTRNRLPKKKDRDGAILRLEIMHASRLKDGTWGPLQALPFNDDTYSIAHPALSPDGKRLFFTSDMPGGFGGKDLYVSYRKEEGWGTPINLGPIINTEGDELYPFFHDNGQLYFSSDGHFGLGGQDIFRSMESGDNEWGTAENMGYPINTSFDDFSIIVDETGGEGYFASNRKGGIGADDIYHFTELGDWVIVQAKNAETGETIENPFFVDSKQGDTLETNTDGELVLRLRPAQCRHLTVNAAQFQSLDIDLCGRDFEPDEITEIKLQPKPMQQYVPDIVLEPAPDTTATETAPPDPKVAEVVVKEQPPLRDPEVEILKPEKKTSRLVVTIVDQYTGKIIPSANVHLLGQGCGEDAYELTGRNGKYTFELDSDCCYQLRVEKADYFASNTETPICIGNSDEIQRDIELEVSLQAFRQSADATPTKYDVSDAKIPFKISERRYAGDNSIPYLLNIYYDLGRASVRPEALPELDKLLKLLKDNPKLKVEISSHTDSQGSSSLNENLSQRRATAIVNYLIKRGISRRQLIGKGYGESQLVNGCSNGVDCTEEQHQMNRRTEFKVLGEVD